MSYPWDDPEIRKSIILSAVAEGLICWDTGYVKDLISGKKFKRYPAGPCHGCIDDLFTIGPMINHDRPCTIEEMIEYWNG